MAQYEELDPVKAEAFIDAYERRLAELRDAGEGDEVSITSGDPDDHPVPEAASEPAIQPGPPGARGSGAWIPTDSHMGD